jgi:hypothetical protein
MGKGDASAAVGRGWGLRALSAKHPVSKAKGPTAARSSCEFFIEGTKSHCFVHVGAWLRHQVLDDVRISPSLQIQAVTFGDPPTV